jgi:hypothetical protein
LGDVGLCVTDPNDTLDKSTFIKNSSPILLTDAPNEVRGLGDEALPFCVELEDCTLLCACCGGEELLDPEGCN